HSLIDMQCHLPIGLVALYGEPIRGLESGDGHRRVHLAVAGFDEVAQLTPERTASVQTVLIAATVDAGRIGTANGPTDPSAGLFITQLSQRQQSVCRRVSGTDDESVPTGELLPVASQNIRQRRCHEPCVTSSRLSDCGKACLPEWVRGLPGAGCINDGTNLMVDDLAISALHSAEEGRSFTAGGACTAHTGPAHSDDSRARVDRFTQLRSPRQGCQVVAHEFGTCGQVITVGFLPIRGFEQCACGLIDVVLPRREETDVTPFENGCGRCGA